jgi:hypothetical protein
MFIEPSIAPPGVLKNMPHFEKLPVMVSARKKVEAWEQLSGQLNRLF